MLQQVTSTSLCGVGWISYYPISTSTLSSPAKFVHLWQHHFHTRTQLSLTRHAKEKQHNGNADHLPQVWLVV